MGTDSLLKEADDLIHGERAEQYGPPAIHWKVVAALWTDFLGYDVTPKDCVTLMALLKIARMATGQNKRDNDVDAAGYIGLRELV